MATEDELNKEYLAKLEAAAEEGISKAAEDNLVPLVYILQKLSPQVDKDDEMRYIKGAEAGDIWLRNSPEPIVRGMEGILFQPVYFYVDWGEWVPRDRGGGFVARHPTNAHRQEQPPISYIEVPDPNNPNRPRFQTHTGNELIITRNHVGFVLPMGYPYVIPMTSTGLRTSKEWMTMQSNKRLPSGKSAAARSQIYRLRTVKRTNQKGSWFTWQLSSEREATPQEFFSAEPLYQAFIQGTKEAERPLLRHEEENPEAERPPGAF